MEKIAIEMNLNKLAEVEKSMTSQVAQQMQNNNRKSSPDCIF